MFPILYLLCSLAVLASVWRMTNMTASNPRRARGNLERSTIDVEAATSIYQGAAIEEGSNGGAQNLVGTNATFLGIADGEALNTGALGAKRVTYIRRGEVLLPVDNNGVAFARTAVGATVYGTDGNTLTTVSTSAQAIGKITEVPVDVVGATSGLVWVAVEGVLARSI